MTENQKLDKAVEALYSALTCVWEDNGNIMAEAVSDYVISVLVDTTGKTFSEVEAEVKRRVARAQTF
ncbi:MAG: hypothetical protein SCARUB_05166 [Candidatus Scalindua rubra]|uniref:Uncharacterized protein n=1 Tax=Candidatus Scalindua rubra TaxID=1872076 RepID=A0A1E3X210_9BACT|nr:MAG: hypothetical protein SCARUB_05166 [Candidatus Scalindua rubra]